MLVTTYKHAKMNMKKFANVSTASSASQFAKAVSYASMIMKENGERFADAAVITELLTMMSVSKKCNHKSNTHKGSISHERVPSDVDKIATQIELMGTNATTNTTENMPTRVNAVTSAIISTIQTMVEFSHTIAFSHTDSHRLVISDVHSTLYAAVIVFAFRIMYLSNNWNSNVEMIVIAEPNTFTSMSVYVGPTDGVTMIKCTDKVVDMYKILSSSRNVNLMVHTYTTEVARMFASTNSNTNANMCWITNLETYQSASVIDSVTSCMDVIAEAVSCSNPNANTIRISTVITHPDVFKNKVASGATYADWFTRLRWFNSMIRHMDVKGMCFDCRVAFTIASPMLLLIKSEDEVVDAVTAANEVANYNAFVGVSGIVDLIDTST